VSSGQLMIFIGSLANGRKEKNRENSKFFWDRNNMKIKAVIVLFGTRK
jgi:hypothetical protein